MWSRKRQFDPWADMEGRGRRRRPWLAAWIILMIGLLVGGIWFFLGGLPFGDHARYGSIPVPGTGQVTLPVGDIRIFFQESDLTGDDSATVPEGVEVAVVGPGGAVAIDKLYSNVGGISIALSTTTIGDVGYTDYGKMDVPSAGDYAVTVTAAGPLDASEPTITVGEPPINPFGPPIVGAAVLVVPFAVIAILLLLFWKR